MLVQTPPADFFKPALRSSLTEITRRPGSELTLEELAVLDYISSLLTDFLPTDTIFTVDDTFGRLDTVTARIKKAVITKGYPFGMDVANFSLYMTGIFYEMLMSRGLERFYEDTGSAAYDRLRRQSDVPEFRILYGMLAENFTTYETVIRNVRDGPMHFERTKDWIKIAPYKKRLRGHHLTKRTIN